METQYRRNLNHTYLTLEVDEVYDEDYQMRMLKANKIDGLLLVAGHGVDGISKYAYDISGKSSLKAIYEKTDISKEELEVFLMSLLTLVKVIQNFMLDANKILLDPEYIFYEKEKYYFCYLPKKEEQLENSFHKLTEYFVSKIDHKDQKGIQTAYILHKATMEENYNLEAVIDQIRQEELVEEEEKEEINYVEKDRQSADYIKESSVAWPVAKQWKGRKKEKWGIWE